jgi:hypothetical protein
MEPSSKSPELTHFLETLAGRTTSIHSNQCVQPPYGCGKPVDPELFRDDLSRREYAISGLCQTCQDEVFMSDEDESEVEG